MLKKDIYFNNYAPVFGFIGDSNVGKTETINNFIKAGFGIEEKLYTSSGQNKTKFTTIIHFGEKEYKLARNNEVIPFTDLKSLITYYNNLNINEEISNEEIELYIAKGDKGSIIDTIGLSKSYSPSDQEKMIKHLERFHKNIIWIHVTRNLHMNLNLSKKHFVILTFADTIDYEKDKPLADSHFEYFEDIKNHKIFFLSNVSCIEPLKLMTKTIDVYNPNSLVNMFNILSQHFDKHTVLTRTELISKLNDFRNCNILEMKKLIRVNNDKMLCTQFQKFISENEIVDYDCFEEEYQIMKSKLYSLSTTTNLHFSVRLNNYIEELPSVDGNETLAKILKDCYKYDYNKRGNMSLNDWWIESLKRINKYDYDKWLLIRKFFSECN